MNKTIKRVIASTMIITAFSMVNVNSKINLYNTKVYASSYDLTELSLGNVNLYENSNYTKEIDTSKSLKDTYYAKLSSDKSKISVDTDGEFVKITKSKSSKSYDQGDDITILTGKTTLYVKVYGSQEDADEGKNCKEQYKINIKRYTSEEENEIKNDDQDEIYLESLELDYGDIPLGFRHDKMNYDVTVDNDVKTLAVKAMPDDGAYTVKINNITVDENDDYKKNINLSNGTTKVEITLSYDEEEKRTYTINITKKEKNESNTENSSTANNGTTVDKDKVENSDKVNNNVQHNTENNNNLNNSLVTSDAIGWFKADNKWKYNDDYKNALKNTWFYDGNYGNTYYFDNDGYMKTGWLQLNNNWYYLNDNGAMATGWKYVGISWYYLDYDGKMKTGWFKDTNGKYYYFYEGSGAMARNTTIGTYKIGNDGAWK